MGKVDIEQVQQYNEKNYSTWKFYLGDDLNSVVNKICPSDSRWTWFFSIVAVNLILKDEKEVNMSGKLLLFFLFIYYHHHYIFLFQRRVYETATRNNRWRSW